MATLFEARFRHDRELLRTTLRATRRRWQPLLSLYAAAMAVVLLSDLRQGHMLSATATALLAGFAAMAFVSSPRMLARRMERNHRKRFGGTLPEATVRFSEEDIQLNERRNEAHFDYAQVERIVRSERMLLLVVAGKLVIPVPDDGFTTGSPQALADFLRGKCPQAKITNHGRRVRKTQTYGKQKEQ